jgi:Protein kinase domain
MADPMGWRPGSWVGRPGRTPEYQLRTLVRVGGEGEVWQAVRTAGGVPQRWAVKILSAERIAPQRNARKVLREWDQRWRETLLRTQSLNLPGIVLPAEVFEGPPPASDRQQAQPAGRLLYMVSRWVDGGQDLWGWRRAETDPMDWCDVLEQICELVEQLAEAGMVHRDLSPANVMVENGKVRLIDFTFMTHAGAVGARGGGTPGYTAPETRDGTLPVAPMIDRYAVGALAFFLLTGKHPDGDPARAARRILRRDFTESLAGHVATLLDPDPGRRPSSLAPWMADFRRLVGNATRAGTGHDDIALAVDGFQTTEIAAAGAGRIAVATANSHRHPMLSDLAEPAPGAVKAVALARRGNGDLAMFTRDALGVLAVRVNGRWHTEKNLRVTGAIRAAAHGDGRASGFVIAAEGHLIQVTVGLDGQVECARLPQLARRVLAAVSGPSGEAFLAVEDPAGAVRCGPPDNLRRTKLSDVAAVALSVNADGEPVCVAAWPGSTELVEVAEPADDFLAKRRPIPGKPNIRDVASVWLRGGPLFAIASDSGLWVGAGRGAWNCLWPEPVSRVALGVGSGWRVQVAAVTEGRVLYAEEKAADQWPARADYLEAAPA